MAAATFITDPDLQSILHAAEATRSENAQLLALLAQQQDPSSEDAQTADSSTSSDSLAAQHRLLRSHLTAVRHQYRTIQSSVRTTKSSTQASRADVDALHLRLQNLYYERAHVAGEIASCESYAHTYTSLPLVPLDEFLALRPEFAATSLDGEAGEAEETAAKTEDEVMKARIEHEHEMRRALEEKRQGLLKRKIALVSENNKRREDLANLDKDLEKFIEAAEPIVKTFEKYGG
jgi:THO complex subunit 5